MQALNGGIYLAENYSSIEIAGGVYNLNANNDSPMFCLRLSISKLS